MAIQLKRESDGVYRYDGFTATRRKCIAPHVYTYWDVLTPEGDKYEMDTLREVREFIADEVQP